MQTARVAPAPLRSVAVLHLGRNGGGPKFAFEMARGLAAQGLAVSSVIAADADNRSHYASVGPVLALPTFSTARGALLRSPLAVIGAIGAVRFLARERVQVVVVAMEQIWQVPVMWLLRATGTPTLLCVHDGTMHPGDSNTLEQALRWMQRRGASGFLAFSDHVADVLRSRWPTRRVATTVHGVFQADGETEMRRRPSSTERPVVGFFGRLSAYKGLGLGYAAITRLREAGTRVVFRVVADGDDPALAGMQHPDDEVRIGWTADEEIPAVLAGFDVLLLPYTEASQSGVLAYALGAALPGVVTPVGGLAEQALESGAAVVADGVEPGALARALREVLEDDRLHASLSDGAARAARGQYSWQRVAVDVLAEARELVARDRAVDLVGERRIA